MKFIHSYWSKPHMDNRWFINDQWKTDVYLYYLSAISVKKHGYKIDLHTDNLGKELLSFIPYDNIYIDLEDINLNPDFWSGGKIVALNNEPVGTFHIDGDIALYDHLEILEDRNYDVLVQENELAIDNYIYEKGSKIIKGLSSIDIFHETALNTGFLKFNTESLKNRYCDTVFEFHNKIYKNFENTDDKDTCITIVLEQEYLKKLVDNEGYTYKCIRGSGLNFWHYIGRQKYCNLFPILIEIDKIDRNGVPLIRSHIQKYTNCI